MFIPKYGPGTKYCEYLRTIELFQNIYKEQGLYFAIAFLYDSQYNRQDLFNMMEILKPITKDKL